MMCKGSIATWASNRIHTSVLNTRNSQRTKWNRQPAAQMPPTKAEFPVATQKSQYIGVPKWTISLATLLIFKILFWGHTLVVLGWCSVLRSLSWNSLVDHLVPGFKPRLLPCKGWAQLIKLSFWPIIIYLDVWGLVDWYHGESVKSIFVTS